MKNKTKKKLGVVAAMLGLVVAVGATAGTTLAKYISSVKVESQTATIAQWGYTITTNANDLFSEQYAGDKIVSAENGSLDVKATAKVVAPGTSSANDEADGALVITINGTAEVDAKLVIDITAFNTVWLDRAAETVITGTDEESGDPTYGTLGEDVYYPLHWTITAGGVENEVELEFDKDDEEATFAEQLAAQIATNLAYEGILPAGAYVNKEESEGTTIVIDLPVEEAVNFDNYKLTIAWSWPLEQNADAEDTILGWLAYNEAAEDEDKIEKGTTISNTDTDGKISGTSKYYDIDLTKYSDEDYNLDVAIDFTIVIVQVQGLTAPVAGD